MRHSIMRRGLGALRARPTMPLPAVTPATREAEVDRLARLTRAIAEASGTSCAALLGMIERRAANVSASDAAAFILEEWNKGGDARARLLDQAMKSPAVLAAERALLEEVRELLRPLGGKIYGVERSKEVRREIVKLLRAKLPDAPTETIVDAAAEAIEFRADRLVVHMDGLVALLSPPELAS